MAVSGPEFWLRGPVPTPPPFSLLATAEVLTDVNPHWQNAVALYPYPTDTPKGDSACGVGTFRAKEAGDDTPLPVFQPIVVYLPETCSAVGVGTDQEAYKARAEAVLNATASFAVERQLVTAEFDPASPYLGDSAASLPNGNTAQTPQAALAILEDALGRTARQGLIHATPSIVSAWDSAGFTLVESGGILRTRRGTPVAVGDGYIDQAPDGHNLTGTTQWAWVTGPVVVLKSEVYMTPDNVKEALDRGNNTITYRAEQNFIVGWDTALQVGVRVDWTL